MSAWRQTANGKEPTDPRMQQIVFQIKAGRPFKAIAEQFGITVARVSAIRRAAGEKRRVEPATQSK
jgi:hypothetical protein